MSCPDCFSGSVHEGKPRGEIVKLHGLDAYSVGPADGRTPKAIIVIIPDAFGWEFVNNRLLADHYADRGDYKVYLPEFMLGKAASASVIPTMRSAMNSSALMKPIHIARALPAMMPFIMTNRIGKSYPRVKAFFEALRIAEGPDAKIAAAGFCWGGKHVLLMSHNVTVDIDGKPTPLLNVGFVGHPSFVEVPADVADTMTVPVAFAVGELDSNLPKDAVDEIRKIVEAKPAPATGEVVVYKDAGHGFCVRADTSLNDVAKQALAAEEQCIAWFNKHLGL
ncbi:dienelactone hydrolase family protein [Sporothrix schenckii 1099-18]|uniref:Dienelactone hydrolase domain-containing protein n=2 Tax=Sporothrix schenckii TaxID=29908 RepID=U7PN69_SPOS1|nr:dienelactone hydrolase family protein [Sporothrix schenckii 1099-18]ERS96194.1 hypothetical protein HMPREF1624_07103 [Sporothrix schenckii ATCC 58251]KJR86870.1 dienelactone hydrolase family protein [Sporothrix schenckii 1099-18]